MSSTATTSGLTHCMEIVRLDEREVITSITLYRGLSLSEAVTFNDRLQPDVAAGRVLVNLHADRKPDLG